MALEALRELPQKGFRGTSRTASKEFQGHFENYPKRDLGTL
jgi:hypothetical protein